MGTQEIAVEVEEDKIQESKTSSKDAQALYEKEMSFLRLADNPNIQKWMEKFVLEPLEQLEKAHNIETKTNENFILKGQVFRLTKIKNWKDEHQKKCDRLKKRVEGLRKEE